MKAPGPHHGLPGLRNEVYALRPQLIRHIVQFGSGTENLIPLWFGEPDVPTPDVICEAARQALARGATFYAPNRGIDELRAAIADYLTALHGRPLERERVTVTGSGVNAIMLSLQSLLNAGDNVVTVTPLWPNFEGAISLLGGEARFAPMSIRDGRWHLELEDLFGLVDPRTKVILVNSPHNPTGWTMTAADQERVVRFCRDRGLWLIADEVYSRLAFAQRVAPSFLEQVESDDRCIVINSFSKAWAMTGWRLGWVVTPPALGRALELLIEINVSCAPPFAQHAGIAALTQGEAFIAEAVARYRHNRDLVHRRLSAMPRVTGACPDGAFYYFFGIDGVADSLAFAEDLIRRRGMGLAPGAAFGPRWESYMRLSFAARTETLAQALDRLEEHLQEG